MAIVENWVNLKRLQLDRTASKIKDIKAEIVDVKSKVKNDNISFKGIIVEDITYVGQEGIIYHQVEELEFSVCLSAEKASEAQEVELSPWIEYLDFQLIDEGQYLQQKVILKLYTLLTKKTQVKVRTGVERTYRVAVVAKEVDEERIIENEFSFETGRNQIKEVEDVTAEINDLKYKIIKQDEVIIQGELQQQFFFCDEQNISRQDSREVTFAASIDYFEIKPEMKVEIKPVIELIDWQITNCTAISTQVVLKLKLRIIDFTELDLALNPSGRVMALNKVVLINQEQTRDVRTFELGTFAFDIRSVKADLADLEIEIISDWIIMQGQLNFDIYYLADIKSEANVEHHQQETVPFSTFINASGIEPGMKVKIEKRVEVEEAKLLNNKLFKQKTLIDFKIFTTEREQVKVTVDETGRLITGQEIIDEGLKELIIDISN